MAAREWRPGSGGRGVAAGEWRPGSGGEGEVVGDGGQIVAARGVAGV